MTRTRPAALTQIVDLFLIELSSYRWAWRSMVITGILGPVFFIVALGFFAQSQGPTALGFILTGNLIMSLMFEIFNRVATHFGFIRFAGMLDYFATLPIQRANLLLAIVLAFLVLALPALTVTLVFGASFLQIPLHIHPLFLLAVPMIALPMSGLGAFIGVSVPNPEQTGSISTLLTLVMLGLGPVLIPAEQLPPVLLTFGWLSPATYAASALRQTLLGPVTGRILLDFAALLAFSLLSLWLVSHKMDWRQ